VPTTLVRDSYGKSRVRLVQVTRHPDRHDVKDVTVDIAFEGDYAAAHLAGDNAHVLPTDTMKNTDYALARRQPVGELEWFGIALGAHFLGASRHVGRVRVRLAEHPWARLPVAGRPHGHAFERAGEARRTATVTTTRDAGGGAGEATVEAGIEDLLVLKTAGSAFEGFARDAYTTLRETGDRLFATVIAARWRYAGGAGAAGDTAYGALWRGVRQLLLETFADHRSASVQHTLYAMGDAVLQAVPEVAEIHLSLPNKHHLLVDLAPLGLDNPNEIFVPTEEPYGLIEATMARNGA
jgi:urate oxidase